MARAPLRDGVERRGPAHQPDGSAPHGRGPGVGRASRARAHGSGVLARPDEPPDPGAATPPRSPVSPMPRSTPTSRSGTTASWKASRPRRYGAGARSGRPGRSSRARCRAARPSSRSRLGRPRSSTGRPRRAATCCCSAHGHLLRVLTAVALRLDPRAGARFALEPAMVSIIGAEHGEPALFALNRGS